MPAMLTIRGCPSPMVWSMLSTQPLRCCRVLIVSPLRPMSQPTSVGGHSTFSIASTPDGRCTVPTFEMPGPVRPAGRVPTCAARRALSAADSANLTCSMFTAPGGVTPFIAAIAAAASWTVV